MTREAVKNMVSFLSELRVSHVKRATNTRDTRRIASELPPPNEALCDPQNASSLGGGRGQVL